VSRRLLLLISDFGRGVLSAAVAALCVSGLIKFWELLAFAGLFGLFDAVFSPSITAITPEIVSEELLPAMNAAGPFTNSLMGQMIGPAVGGALTAFSASLAIGVDAATFFFSALMLFVMKKTPRPQQTSSTSIFEEMKGGLSFFFQTRWMWTTCIAVAFINALVFMPSGALLPYFYRHDLHLTKVTVGFAFAIAGAFGTVGALVSSNLKIPRRRIRVMWMYWIIGTLSALFIGIANNLAVAIIFPIISLITMLMGNVIFTTMMQVEVPKEMLGRASSIDWFFSLGLGPLGLVLGGILASHWGVRTYFVVMGVACAVPGTWILLSKRINEVDRSRLRQEV